jgi:hypothetical protein
MRKSKVRKVLLNQDATIRVRYLCPSCKKSYEDLPSAVGCILSHSDKTAQVLPIVDRMYSDYLGGKDTKGSYIPVEISFASRAEPVVVKSPVNFHRELREYWSTQLPAPAIWKWLEVSLTVAASVILAAALYSFGNTLDYFAAVVVVTITLLYASFALWWHGNDGKIWVLPIRPGLVYPILAAEILGFICGVAARGGTAG